LRINTRAVTRGRVLAEAAPSETVLSQVVGSVDIYTYWVKVMTSFAPLALAAKLMVGT
jgi:hypothetical protein